MDTIITIDIVFIILAYLFGSISSAILICKLFGLQDPRTFGSKNPGATNVLRLGGKKIALLTLLGDSVKAVIPVLIAKFFGLSHMVQSFVVLAACIGHMFPLFFKFKGGKGVATGFGGIVALAWPVGLMTLATWLVIAITFRYSSLSALISFLLLPFYVWLLSEPNYLLGCTLLSIIVIVKHHSNIKNLLTGKEDKFSDKT